MIIDFVCYLGCGAAGSSDNLGETCDNLTPNADLPSVPEPRGGAKVARFCSAINEVSDSYDRPSEISDSHSMKKRKHDDEEASGASEGGGKKAKKKKGT